MKCLDNNAIPDLECPMCGTRVKAHSYSNYFGEDKFNYMHSCYTSLSIQDLERCENYKQGESNE